MAEENERHDDPKTAQRKKDARVKAALEAYIKGRTEDQGEGRPRKVKPASEVYPLWHALWEAFDFSWSGLADAGWERGAKANAAQKLKRWRAPADFPVEGRVYGKGTTASKQATLQDYWRWSIGVTDDPAPGRLLSDAELFEHHLLLKTHQSVYHALHCQDVRLDAVIADNDDIVGKLNTVVGKLNTLAAGSGSDTKASEALVRTLIARLEYAQECRDEDEPSLQVLLHGLRAAEINRLFKAFATWDDQQTLHVAAPLSYLSPTTSVPIGLDFTWLTFGKHTNFYGAYFRHGARFVGAKFGDRTNFQGAYFGSEADFAKATLGEGTNFKDATLGDRTSFWKATLGDDTSFLKAVLGKQCIFRGATLGDRTSFWKATLGNGTDFSLAIIGNGTDFQQATLGDLATFKDVTLGDETNFLGAELGDGTSFRNAKLGDGANFQLATLGNGANFQFANLGVGADFDSGVLGKETSFAEAELGRNASFANVRFGDGTDFEGATLGDEVRYSGAQFGGAASWKRARFLGSSDFTDTKWGDADTSDEGMTSLVHHGGAFDGARFEDIANFKSENFSAFAAFHDATFKQRLLLAPPTLGETPDTLFTQACVSAEAAVKAELNRPKGEDESEEAFAAWKKTARREVPDRVWSELSSGYRTAKIAMREQGDFDREQIFYRFEIKSRMKRPSVRRWMKRPSVSRGEKVAAWLYGLASDYGSSIWRPQLTLLIATILFSFVYFTMAIQTGMKAAPPWQASAHSSWPLVRPGLSQPAWQSLELSVNNAFRPFSALSTDEPREQIAGEVCTDCSVAERLLFHPKGEVRFTMKAIAIIQSLLSFALVFLSALAVRRKFQIS